MKHLLRWPTHSCSVCGHESVASLDVFNDEPNCVIHCNFCGFEFLQPRPSFRQLQNYYDGYGTTKVSDEDFKFLFEQSLSYFRRFAKSVRFNSENVRNRKLLEVGFGHGASLLAAARLGFQAYGVDLDATAISSIERRAEQYQVRVHCFHGDVNCVTSDLQFDVIKASQVVE